MCEEYKIKRIFIFGSGKITQKIINDEYPDVRVCRVENIETLEESIQEIKHPEKKGQQLSEDDHTLDG